MDFLEFDYENSTEWNPSEAGVNKNPFRNPRFFMLWT